MPGSVLATANRLVMENRELRDELARRTTLCDNRAESIVELRAQIRCLEAELAARVTITEYGVTAQLREQIRRLTANLTVYEDRLAKAEGRPAAGGGGSVLPPVRQTPEFIDGDKAYDIASEAAADQYAEDHQT
jgi:hypothetical protein